MYIQHIFFIYLSVSGLLGCLCVLSILNSSTVNIGLPVYFQIMVLSRHVSRSRIVGSCGNSTFSFLVVVTQSCLAFWDPMGCSSPGASVHGILQATILEWVAMPSSRGLSQPRENPGLPHCRWFLYCLSHHGSLESSIEGL